MERIDQKKLKDYQLLFSGTKWPQVLRRLGLQFREHSSGKISLFCVFHRERNPSLICYSEPSRFKCYGCGRKGDMAEFLLRIPTINFDEGSLKELFDSLSKQVDQNQMQMFTMDTPFIEF